MNENKPVDQQEIQQRLHALLAEGEALSEQSRRRIVALKNAATPGLLEIVEDRRLWDDQAPGEGWAPIHAAEILGDIGDPDALDRLFAVFREVDPDAILDDALTDAIRSHGPAAIPAGLRALESWDDPFLANLAYLFSGLNLSAPTSSGQGFARQSAETDDTDASEHDAALHRKTLQVLLKYFMQQPVPGAELLAEFGDPVALDALTVALDRYIAAAGGDSKYRRPIFALTWAIEELGGELSESQRLAVDTLKAKRSRSEEVLDKLHAKETPDESRTVKKSRDLGRNDPCWCGSGRKYKRCHLAADAEPPEGAAPAGSD
jgi:hypothetical protein